MLHTRYLKDIDKGSYRWAIGFADITERHIEHFPLYSNQDRELMFGHLRDLGVTLYSMGLREIMFELKDDAMVVFLSFPHKA